jgi:hypothetical protein
MTRSPFIGSAATVVMAAGFVILTDRIFLRQGPGEPGRSGQRQQGRHA